MNKQIIAIIWSHYHTPLDYRDKLTLSRKEIQKCLHLIVDGHRILELAALSTCNRIEFYALAENSIDVLDAIENLYTMILKRNIFLQQSIPENYYGMEAVQHLCRVAAGMKSMVLGEIQIFSQVKVAQKMLRNSQPDADVLNQLFNVSIQCAEVVRNETPIYSGPTSISELAVETAQYFFNDLAKKKVLVIGAGETAGLTARHFKASMINQIIIANRSEKNGRELAEDIHADYINFLNVNDALGKCDIVVAATHSRDYLIGRKQIEYIMGKRNEKLLLLDLSVPRNFDPSIYDIGNVHLYSLDHLDTIVLKNIKKNNEALEKAELIIKEHSQELMNWFQLIKLQEIELELVEEG